MKKSKTVEQELDDVTDKDGFVDTDRTGSQSMKKIVQDTTFQLLNCPLCATFPFFPLSLSFYPSDVVCRSSSD